MLKHLQSEPRPPATTSRGEQPGDDACCAIVRLLARQAARDWSAGRAGTDTAEPRSS
jgi:hypothetical protein